MNRFPSNNFPYQGRDVPGRAYGPYSSSANGTLVGAPAPQPQQQMAAAYGHGQGQSGGGGGQPQVYFQQNQNGGHYQPGSGSMSSTTGHPMWERQNQAMLQQQQQLQVAQEAQNYAINREGYIVEYPGQGQQCQYQQGPAVPFSGQGYQYQGQQQQRQIPTSEGYQVRQQQMQTSGLSMPQQQYVIQHHQGYSIQGQGLGQQQPPAQQVVERQPISVEHYHPYRRQGPPQSHQQQQPISSRPPPPLQPLQPPQPRRTGFLEQLLENKPVSRVSYPYRHASTRGVGGGAPASSTSSPSGVPQGYGSVAQGGSDLFAINRSAFVMAARATALPMSQPSRAIQNQAISNVPTLRRLIPRNPNGISNSGNTVTIPIRNVEGEKRGIDLAKAKADERFNRNNALLDTILDDKIVDLNQSYVSTRRLSTLKNQVQILSGELEKQVEDANKTKETYDKKLEDFKSSSVDYHRRHDQLSKPISQETYRELIDKFYNESKEKVENGETVEEDSETETNNVAVVKPIESGKAEAKKVQFSPGSTPPICSEDDDLESSPSSPDITFIGEIKVNPKFNLDTMSRRVAPSYLEQYHPGFNQGLGESLPQQSMASAYQQQPLHHLGFQYPQFQHPMAVEGIQMQMPFSNAPPPPPSSRAVGGPMSYSGGNYFNEHGLQIFESITPPPTDFFGSQMAPSQMAGYGNRGISNRFPHPMTRSNVTTGGVGPTITNQRDPWPIANPISQQPNSGGERVQHQHQQNQRQPGHLPQERRPTEDLRKFLIKLVKDKCTQGGSGGANGAASQRVSDGGNGGQQMQRPNGLFCGGGIMEVNGDSSAPTLPLAPTLQLPPCDWFREEFPEGNVFTNETDQTPINEQVDSAPVGVGDDDDGSKQDEEGGNPSQDPELEAAIGAGNGSGPSKLTELLEAPLPIRKRNSLKQVENALDSQHELDIPDQVDNDEDDDGDQEDEDGLQDDETDDIDDHPLQIVCPEIVLDEEEEEDDEDDDDEDKENQ